MDTMDNETLRLLVQHKLQDGRLPLWIGKIWTVPGGGTSCDACEASITKEQLVQEVALAGGRGAKGTIQLHVRCFQVWDHERRAA